MVYLGVEGCTLFVVLSQEFFWAKDFLFFFGELALVEVQAQVHQLFCCEAARFLVACLVVDDLHAIAPPVLDGLTMFCQHGLCLREVLVAFGHIQTVEPRFLRAEAFLCPCCLLVVEEEDVCGDTGIGREDRARQTDDGVEIELTKKLFLDGKFGVVRSKEEAVRQDDCGPAMLCQTILDDHHKEVGCLAGCKVAGEVALHFVLLVSAIRWIHQDNIETVIIRIVQDILGERVAMIDLWRIDIVEQHIGDAKHVGELLLLDSVDALGIGLSLFGCGDFLVERLEPRSEKATRSASKVGHPFSHLWGNHFCHEVCKGAWGVELASRASRLHLLQDGFVDFSKGVTLLVAAEVEPIYDVYDLTKQNAILHVLIGILESGTNYGTPHGCLRRYLQLFEGWKECAVHEVEQLVGSQGRASSVVLCPIAPTTFLWDEGCVVVLVELPVVFLLVVYFQEEHPGNLFYSLGVTIDASIIAHDVADVLYKIR